MSTFSLAHLPWLRVRLHDGTLTELSLADTFARATDIRDLVSELPTQVLSQIRLLNAVLLRALAPLERPRDQWRGLWQADRLPVAEINEYLREYEDRFDLLDPVQPFMQVADLRISKGEVAGFDRFIADAPANGYFTMRRGAGAQRLSYAEAARWLVHVQAYGVSGIYPAAIGDKTAKGGKRYPQGTGFAGELGGVMLEGRSLKETLLLNLVLGRHATTPFEEDNEEDLPVWERSQLTESPETRVPEGPRGQADLFTWQSRRARLIHDGESVTGVVLCYGDELRPQNNHRFETMSAWRISDAQTKKGGGGKVYMPVRHRPERAVWRGLSALLPQATLAESDSHIAPSVIRWAGEMSAAEVLPDDFPLRTRAIGVAYGTQNSVIDEVVDDSLDVTVALLQAEYADLAAVATEMVERTEQAVRAIATLAADLVVAAGGDSLVDGPTARDRASESAYALIDAPFRRWISALGATTDRDDARGSWVAQARGLLRQRAEEMVAQAGTAAWAGRWVGRDDKQNLVNSSKAYIWFSTALGKALPAVHVRPEAETHEVAENERPAPGRQKETA